MGISHKSVHYLYPEEVCFLLERNAAELTMNEQSVDYDVIFLMTIINRLSMKTIFVNL